uniref:Glycosyltransferase n=1 Tax=Astragalus membranaceus TaxID=649199 RepID=A0AA49KF33_ASTME|nr:UDP-glucosyltransferase UGT88E30 [Astragalus membranaceus]
MKDTIVLYPGMGSGHLMSMVELGKLIITRHPSFHITILILTPPKINNNTPTPKNDSITQYIAFVSSTFPSITFLYIPTTQNSFPTSLPMHLLTLELSPRNNHHVQHLLQSISKTSNLKAVVLDFLTYSASKITTILEIPTYFYYTSSASLLALFLHFPTFHQNAKKPIKEIHMHTAIQIPGLPIMSLEDYPDDAKDPTSQSYRVLLDSAKIVRESVGIIVNTFDDIERRAIKALKEGLCIPDGIIPQLFFIGPVVSNSTSCEKDENECLSWLNSQPSQSVVLLSFGSMGSFSWTQLKEIAIGLEKSGQRFLWVVRCKNELVERVDSDGGVERVDSEKLSLDELLPKGFLERTKDKGMVVRNWAPQAAILSHDSVGGFVTHCGWNSVLEAVTYGVPMVTWPLYAEQKLNRVILVKEMKVALELNELENGFVSATELGERVKELMELESGKEIRERIYKMKVSAKEARGGGGSSLVDLKRLQDSWRQQ